jgi:hypothetical protein
MYERYRGHDIRLAMCSHCAVHITIDGVDLGYRVPDGMRDPWRFAMAVARGVVDRTVVIEATATGVVTASAVLR